MNWRIRRSDDGKIQKKQYHEDEREGNGTNQ